MRRNDEYTNARMIGSTDVSMSIDRKSIQQKNKEGN